MIESARSQHHHDHHHYSPVFFFFGCLGVFFVVLRGVGSGCRCWCRVGVGVGSVAVPYSVSSDVLVAWPCCLVTKY